MSSNSEKNQNPIRIVILGAGFGGIYAYLGLYKKKFHQKIPSQISIISENDYFLFLTLLHEVATGNLLPSSITQPIRTMPHCCLDNFIHGVVKSINLDEQTIELERKSPNCLSKQNQFEKIQYNYLISALGSDTNFYNIPGAKQFCLTLKNQQDAKRIKNRILDCFESASYKQRTSRKVPTCSDINDTKFSSKDLEKAHIGDKNCLDDEEVKNLLRFVIVGGGPTGVELAGEIADYINGRLYSIFPSLKGIAEVILIEHKTQLLPKLDKWFGKRVHRILNKFGVKIILGKPVNRVSPDGLYIEKSFIPTKTVIWTAGVKARQVKITAQKQIEYEKHTWRIKVNPYLQLDSYPNVFVIGDQAWIYNKEAGQPYPMRAQFAQREGKIAAENIFRQVRNEKLKEFHWKDQGFIVSLGKTKAIGRVFGIKVFGFWGWCIYRTAYLLKLVGWRAKLRTALEWILDLFFSRDVSKL